MKYYLIKLKDQLLFSEGYKEDKKDYKIDELINNSKLINIKELPIYLKIAIPTTIIPRRWKIIHLKIKEFPRKEYSNSGIVISKREFIKFNDFCQFLLPIDITNVIFLDDKLLRISTNWCLLCSLLTAYEVQYSIGKFFLY